MQVTLVAGTRSQRYLHLDLAILIGEHPLTDGSSNRMQGNRTVGSNPTSPPIPWPWACPGSGGMQTRCKRLVTALNPIQGASLSL